MLTKIEAMNIRSIQTVTLADLLEQDEDSLSPNGYIWDEDDKSNEEEGNA